MRTSPNWLVGNSTETHQWESGNSSVSFPFADDSLPADFPNDMVVDACIVVANEVEPSAAEVSLGCVHVGNTMASAFVLVDGEPALYCNVLAENYEPFTPVAMTPVKKGVSGMLTFGDVRFGEKRTYRANARFSESAIVRPVVGRLVKFTQPEMGSETNGVVPFELPDGITITVDEDGNDSTVHFSADSSIRNLVPMPCAEQDSPKTMTVPVKSINGLVPDELGRIAVVFLRSPEELKLVEGLEDSNG